MKLRRLILGAMAAALLPAAMSAQDTSLGYHAVACYKVKAGKTAEIRKFLEEETHPLAQGRVDDGEITAFYLLRAVIPQGEATQCDYIVVTFFPKLPHLFNEAMADAAIKKGGLKFTAKEYMARRDELVSLQTVGIYQNLGAAGTSKKGDFFQVNYMQVTDANLDEYVDYEKKVWIPFVQENIKQGKESGWSINLQILPTGTSLPYQVVTVDVFPSMDAVFAFGDGFYDRFKKAHPDMEAGTTFEKYDKLRNRSMVQLYELEDYLTK